MKSSFLESAIISENEIGVSQAILLLSLMGRQRVIKCDY